MGFHSLSLADDGYFEPLRSDEIRYLYLRRVIRIKSQATHVDH